MRFASETRFYVYLFKQHALFLPPRIPILPRQWEEAKRNIWRISGAIHYTPVRANTGKIIFACLLVYPATLGQWGVPAGASYINIANNHGPVSQAQKNITPVGTGFVIYSTESIPTFTYNSIISRQTTTLSPSPDNNSLSIFYFHPSLLRVYTKLLPLSHPRLTETGVAARRASRLRIHLHLASKRDKTVNAKNSVWLACDARNTFHRMFFRRPASLA